MLMHGSQRFWLRSAGRDAATEAALKAFRSTAAAASTCMKPSPAATPVATRKENPENNVMHALSQRLILDNALRYKVKMWMFRNAAAKVSDASGDASASVASGAIVEGGGASDGHVGYCMMTMIIRNGLRHLIHGRHAFAEHALLVARHHCVPQHCVVRLVEFAQAWYDWAHMHAPELVRQLRAGDHHLASSCYLMHAERFAHVITQGPLASSTLATSTGAGSTGVAAANAACAPCMKLSLIHI